MLVYCVLNSIMIKFVSWKFDDLKILNHLHSIIYVHLPSYCMKHMPPKTKISETKHALSTNYVSKKLVHPKAHFASFISGHWIHWTFVVVSIHLRPKKLGILFEKKQQFQYIVVIIIIISSSIILSSSIRHFTNPPNLKNKLQPKDGKWRSHPSDAQATSNCDPAFTAVEVSVSSISSDSLLGNLEQRSLFQDNYNTPPRAHPKQSPWPTMKGIPL